MKAVVVEQKGQRVAVLREDGRICHMPNQQYAIGEVILMKAKVRTVKWVAAIAAAVAVVAGGALSVAAYRTPYAYVSLDVNPSIEFSLNCFDRVLTVKAVNEDAEAILDKVDVDNLGNKSIDEALKLTVKALSEQGYFEGEDGGVVIATSAKDLKAADRLAGKLKETVEDGLTQNGDTVEVEAQGVGAERVEKAHELGVTPGKLNLVEKMIASAEKPEEIVLTDWLNKPVKEIMAATKSNRKAAKANEKATAATSAETTAAVADSTAATSETSVTQADTQSEESGDTTAAKTNQATEKSRKTERAQTCTSSCTAVSAGQQHGKKPQ